MLPEAGQVILLQNQPGTADQIGPMTLGQPTENNTVLLLGDAMALSYLQTPLALHGKSRQVKIARSTSFDDLRTGPDILIGALDNP